ncbi:interferon-induced protein with tetratricopeptide repeats 5-like [Xenopus laevis]|uniref:Interferon-induced protein with tetratricopeptide repeats 5-like n=1 Tax=Xenopus laevis TaxID=8355 RepID=A0A8J1LD98_XENLA|nr:interferon-induced protein with tetratricopeptide repeats 5-like [Xenopus laevis]
MSNLSDELLKNLLLKLECHFTWTYFKDETDIDNIEDRLHDQITFLPSIPRHRLHNLLAYTNYLKGGNEEAITQLQKAEEHLQGTQSADLDIKRAVTYSNYAWLYYHSNEFSKAQSYLEKVEAIYKKYESSPEHDILLTEIYGEQAWTLLTFYGKFCERAKECFEKALVLNPDNPELNSGYATVMYRLENQDNRFYAKNNCESLELLKCAVKLNENDSVIKALLALKYLSMDQAEEGEKIMEEALRQTPDSPYLLRYAAKFYRKEGKVDAAITVLKKALNQTPNSCSLHYQIGLCYKDKMLMLITSAKTAKSLNQPTNTFTRDIRDTIFSAIFHFEKTLELKKIFVEAYINLAYIYSKDSQFEKAEAIYQKALNLSNITCEEKQEVHWSYAKFKQYQNRSEYQAIRHYKEVLLIPNTTKIRSFSKNNLEKLAKKKISSGFGLLGFISQQDGDVTQSIDYYEKALELDPNNEDYLSALHGMRISE